MTRTRFATTTLPRGRTQAAMPAGHALTALFSPDAAVRHRVAALLPEAPPLVIGREGPAVGFALDDPLVSRQHAQVGFDAARQQFVLADLGSRNGTFLDGQPVAREVLNAGAVVRVGDTLFRFAPLALDAVGWQAPPGGLLCGRSPALREVLRQVAQVAASDLGVLLLGASGTGKDVVAREIHRQSGRRGPYLAVNCAALPAELIESELFGHRKGAFSGALQDRHGILAAGAGGTVLLDEVGEMTPALQAKLLRVIETRAVRPVGGAREEPIDVRFLFATNRDLAAEVAAGRFRPDLFARLSGWTLRLPPLAERPEDIAPILAAALAEHGGGRPYALSADAFEALVLYPWPYNVRELVQLARRLVVRLPAGGTVGIEHVAPDLVLPAAAVPPGAAAARCGPGESGRPSAPGPLPPPGEEPTAAELGRLLQHFEGRIADVARYAGRPRPQVYRWLKRHGLDPERYR